MPSPSTSTFMKRSASMSSLSHSMTWRSSMRAGSIGTRSSSRSSVSTKPPGCCDRWRGKPISVRARSSVRRSRRSCMLKFSSAARSSSTPSSPQCEICVASAPVTSSVSPIALPDVADRASAAIADHRGADRGAMPAIGVEYPLDDLLAPFMLEIDVDVGRFLALGTDETFEQQAGAGRVDRGDAEHVAHRGIGGGPAALAQDVLRAWQTGRCCPP